MKQQVMEQKSRLPIELERLMRQNWCSLGARTPYWSGSPWRAVGMLFHRDSDA